MTSGYTYIALDDSFKLYSDIISRKAGGRDGWRAVAAAATALAEAAGRAQVCICGSIRGPALRQAEELLNHVLDSSIAQHLCSAIEDARADAASGVRGAAEAAAAALKALAAFVHAPSTKATSASMLDHFPLAQALSNKVTESQDRGEIWEELQYCITVAASIPPGGMLL